MILTGFLLEALAHSRRTGRERSKQCPNLSLRGLRSGSRFSHRTWAFKITVEIVCDRQDEVGTRAQ